MFSLLILLTNFRFLCTKISFLILCLHVFPQYLRALTTLYHIGIIMTRVPSNAVTFHCFQNSHLICKYETSLPSNQLHVQQLSHYCIYSPSLCLLLHSCKMKISFRCDQTCFRDWRQDNYKKSSGTILMYKTKIISLCVCFKTGILDPQKLIIHARNISNPELLIFLRFWTILVLNYNKKQVWFQKVRFGLNH
jgi:hypothetical protein